ncbi:glycine--tRNA ligase subunit beta [Sulfuritalea hydrogenivorans]|jgi:glycyl-tRNA synthetase beta chain|uniref:Glycine--tRNA ligase beta subunit n=1 Tax=Sulfuritalea hydrogenivorans sk43H TaxID=1223802 RepID=W0SIW6_9PROT|nr:glycine--tRNA ligase subunit beta [Sulfuritalea hydrogenivorans]MDK9713393.1 glycine--tRNA ligase subunit beta [Sulfuritalea sp.]BAO30907.1 glycine tRNA synthetase, beta subunit [Sulfuritalea hydrogenivorans sk43H]
MKATLLIELLTEELPPKSLAKLGLSFREQMQKALSEAGFIDAGNEGRWYATPRRLALQFDACLESQPDRVIEKKGPAVASGVGADGTPTKALEGFMRSAGVEFAQLEKLSDGKAEYFVARIKKTGERIDMYLPDMMEAALKKLPVAKLMRWGAGEAQFVRPVHGLMLMHGARTIPGKVLDLDSRNVTRGHRFMSVGVIDIPRAENYEAILEKEGRVIASFDKRRAMIVEQLDRAAGQLTWLRDEALLDEVTALVEFPAVYEANFDVEFLAVPQECLILTMKANQKYFPLMDGSKLTHRFLVVSNMKVADPINIVTGNARVVRPRLADAKFFFETDKKTPLSARIGKLSRVVYHNKLGTQGERVDRLVKLAAAIARRIGADAMQAEQAALLAKADLVTDMVGEFPELQGIMGRYYALADGEPAVVADAIQSHYQPRFNGDTLPQGHVACAVALADKLDALIGFFGIGQIPTGDKDPFGLRRAALGVLRILMETPLALSLPDLIDDAAAGFAPELFSGNWRAASADFFKERLRHMLRDAGHDPKAVDAVLALDPTRIDQVPAKLAAVKAFAALPEAEALAAANKRVGNILKKVEGAVAPGFDNSLLQEAAERALAAMLPVVKADAEAAFERGDYTASLQALAKLRTPVDAFFNDVMVNAEDPALRANRLGLLATLHNAMNRVADISKLSS